MKSFVKKLSILLFGGFLILGYLSSGYAQDSGKGSQWSLTFSGSSLPDSDPSHETFRITLGVDLASYYGGGSFIDQVALKVADSITSISLFSAPGGTSAWVLTPGALSNGGCNGTGGGFECANSTLTLNDGMGVPVGNPNPGIDYAWVFDISMNNGELYSSISADGPWVKARFVDSNGSLVTPLVKENVALTSETSVSPIPEPEVYAMLSLGLGFVGWIGRRKNSKARAAA